MRHGVGRERGLGRGFRRNSIVTKSAKTAPPADSQIAHCASAVLLNGLRHGDRISGEHSKTQDSWQSLTGEPRPKSARNRHLATRNVPTCLRGAVSSQFGTGVCGAPLRFAVSTVGRLGGLPEDTAWKHLSRGGFLPHMAFPGRYCSICKKISLPEGSTLVSMHASPKAVALNPL